MGLESEKRGERKMWDWERTSQTLRKEEIECEATTNGGGGAIYGSNCPITMQRERERESFDLGFGDLKGFLLIIALSWFLSPPKL